MVGFWLLFILYMLLSCTGLLLIKMGGSTTKIALEESRFLVNVDLKFVLGLCFYIMSFLLFTYVIQKRNLSYIGPLGAGFINIITVAMGILFLHEKVSAIQMVGAGVVIVGIVLMNIRG